MQESDGLIDSFVRRREVLLREADAVPLELRTTPFVGHWNLMDLLAHLIGWDYTNVRAIQALQAGNMPDFYRYYDPGWTAYNQQLLDRYGLEDWDTLRYAITRSQAAVVRVLRRLSSEDLTRELTEPGRRRPITLAGILRAAIRDEREHLEQIQVFLASKH